MGYTVPNATSNPAFRHVVVEIAGVDNTNPASPIAKGTLISRMTDAERNSIITAPAGLLVYVIDGGSPGFYFNTRTGTPSWERILSGSNNSANGIFTITDSILAFNSAEDVSINTRQNNALNIGKNGSNYIKIPSSFGQAGNGSTGMVITDNNNFTVFSSAILALSSDNKGFLLPRVTNLSSIPLPAYGLLIIVQNGNATNNGLYIQTSTNPTTPNWVRLAPNP